MDPIEDWLTQPDGLADRLRVMRTQAGLSGKALAEATGWQPSKISRLENGRQMPTPADLEKWARACHADASTSHALMALLDDFKALHRDWKRRMRRGQEAVQLSYNQIVEQSENIRHFETVYIPGMLQTVDYARRTLNEMVDLHGLKITDVDEAVSARMARQRLLYDPSKNFEFLLAEPVLLWHLCPAEIMRPQLDRLQTVLGLPNVRLGILPLGIPLKTTPQNSFQLYDDLAIVETFIGEATHQGEEADAYARALERLWLEAKTGEDARQIIISASEAVSQPHG